jgi:N-acyl-D-aspartate/D-glutamate deacylase
MLVGHSALRLLCDGEASQERAATDGELETMRRVLREALEAGRTGYPVTRTEAISTFEGKRIPAAVAPEEEAHSLYGVLGEVGTGAIQSGGGAAFELKNRLMSRLSESAAAAWFTIRSSRAAFAPEKWKEHLTIVQEACEQGVRALPLISPTVVVQHFTMKELSNLSSDADMVELDAAVRSRKVQGLWRS